MLARIQAGATGYDIVFSSAHLNDIMAKLGLLERTGMHEHPDPADLRSRQDHERACCLPYARGTVGIVCDEKVTGPIPGWDDFFAIPEKTGDKITPPDGMREVLAIGLIVTGASVHASDPAGVQAATHRILARKPAVPAFTHESGALLASGDIAAAHVFIGGKVFCVDNPDVHFVIPKEGATIYQENTAPSTARRTRSARAGSSNPACGGGSRR